MQAVNLNDTPLYLHEWAELDHIAALERHAKLKLTAADLDAADIRRQARERHTAELVALSVAARTSVQTPAFARLYRRIKRTLRVAWLHWTISSNEQWLAYARRDGVLTSDNLRHVRAELEALRVELAVAEGARP